MAAEESERRRAIEAVRILNELWWDTLAGDGLFQHFEEHPVQFRSEEHLVAIQRMGLAHLAMVLSKLWEFHRHYTRLLPAECQPVMKALNKDVERRGVRKFRNKIVGHILDEATDRPLPEAEIQAVFDRLVEEDSEAFFRWMRNARAPEDRSTVMGTIAWVRDALMQEHGFSAADVGLKPSPGAGE